MKQEELSSIPAQTSGIGGRNFLDPVKISSMILHILVDKIIISNK